MPSPVTIRNATPEDLESVIALDEVTPPEERQRYWSAIFDRYAKEADQEARTFLVAEEEGVVVGFIVAEIRAWEFGSAPCGWVFALAVSPQIREGGVGRLLFQEVCDRMKRRGISTVRTMVDRDNKLTLSFFRSQGLRTGKYIELEKDLD